jgi:hypothetical protein
VLILLVRGHLLSSVELLLLLHLLDVPCRGGRLGKLLLLMILLLLFELLLLLYCCCAQRQPRQVAGKCLHMLLPSVSLSLCSICLVITPIGSVLLLLSCS